MFWKTEICEAATLSDLLKKDNVTIEEVLDDEFTLQELKTNNRELITFLTTDSNITKLVELSLKEPPEDENEEKSRYRYAYLSSEVLSSNCEDILSAVLSTESSRTVIGDFLNVPPPINPLLTSFYTRIVSQLVSRKPEEMLELLRERSWFVKCTVSHLNNSAVAELLFNLVTVPTNETQANAFKQWLCDEKLASHLTALFVTDADPDSQSNAAYLWSELVRLLRDILYAADEKFDDCLLNVLQGREALSELLNRMLDLDAVAQRQSIVVQGAQVFLALLRTHHIPNNPAELSERAANPNRWRGGPPNKDNGATINDPDKLLIEAPDGEFWSPDTERITECVLSERLADLDRLITQQTPTSSLLCSMGPVSSPLGAGRLTVAKMLVALLNTNLMQVHQSFAHLGLIGSLMRWVCAYPWNNLMHSTLVQCVTFILFSRLTDSTQNVVPSPLIKHLLIDCGLIDLIINETATSKEEKTKTRVQRSFTGHLFQISRQIENARLRGPNKAEITRLLSENDLTDKWSTFVESVLIPYQELNEPDNVDLPVSLLGAVADEDFAQASTSSSAANQAFSDYQMQTMAQQPLTEHFGLPMDTFTAEGDSSIDVLAAHTKTLDFNAELALQDAPPGESAFEQLCAQRLGSGDAPQETCDPFGLGTGNAPWMEKNQNNENWANWDNIESGGGLQDMEVDENSWPGEAQVKAKEERKSSSEEDWAKFNQLFPGQSPPTPTMVSSDAPPDNWAQFDKLSSQGAADWALSSPASQGLAVATSMGTIWPIDPLMMSPGKNSPGYSTPPKSPRAMIVTLSAEESNAVANGPVESNC